MTSIFKKISDYFADVNSDLNPDTGPKAKKKVVNTTADAAPGFQIAQSFNQVATMLYHDKGNPNGSSKLSAKLLFDESLRVKTLKDFVVDGKPKIPSFEVTEAINQLMSPFATLDKNQRPTSLDITIENGQISVKADY